MVARVNGGRPVVGRDGRLEIALGAPEEPEEFLLLRRSAGRGLFQGDARIDTVLSLDKDPVPDPAVFHLIVAGPSTCAWPRFGRGVPRR